MSITAPPLQVLIVEDEYFIADDLVRALRQEGLVALPPVGGPAAAIAALDQGDVDFAVVDINLDGAISFTVAAELRRRAIPFLFLTGYDSSIVPQEYSDVIILQKPNDGEAIVAEIRRQQGAASPATD